MEKVPRYSILEIERRWLVDPKNIENLSQFPVRLIEDRYLIGTRVRLRVIRERNGQSIYKLGKKYGKTTFLAEPITTLYLTFEEYDVFSKLPAHRVRKHRYAVDGGSLDIYIEPAEKIMIYELEFSTEEEANKYSPPKFVGEEVTGDPNYSGFTLSVGNQDKK